jgi:hypothetical protein
MRHLLLSVLACFTLCASARGADELGSLTQAVKTLRSTHGTNTERDAGPELTPIKQALRHWIETQIVTLPDSNNDTGILTRLQDALTTDINAAGLQCGDAGEPNCGRADQQFNARGYLDGVRLAYLDGGRYLTVETGVGIVCGYDQSAYIYERDSNRAWQLLLQSEQDDYRQDKYSPQDIEAIRVSPASVMSDKPAPPLILTLGISPWCSSNWQGLSIRLWRADSQNPTPAPILYKTTGVYLGSDPIADGRVTNQDLLIQYTNNSIDEARFIRPYILHYAITAGDRLTRIAPVALTPEDFVDEWLTSNWRDSAHWSNTHASAALANWHKNLGVKTDGFFFGDGNTSHCRDPALWQVAFSNTDKNGNPQRPAYFLVRWLAPYRFTMMGVATKAYADCDRADAMTDNPVTLFQPSP